MDWFGIHEKICQLLGALRTLRPTLGSEDERQRRNLTVQMSQHALIDRTFSQPASQPAAHWRALDDGNGAAAESSSDECGGCCCCRRWLVWFLQ